jgi:hypothetical protein
LTGSARWESVMFRVEVAMGRALAWF